jgi:hypothetical protein
MAQPKISLLGTGIGWKEIPITKFQAPNKSQFFNIQYPMNRNTPHLCPLPGGERKKILVIGIWVII